MLALRNSDSRQIILGSMFLQSFYVQYSQFGFNGVLVTLMKNENALAATYLGDAVLATGEDPFSISPFMMTAAVENDGLPTFSATMTGIDAESPYFYIDFSSSKTVVWAINCVQDGIEFYKPGLCSDAPTFTSNAFNGENLTSYFGNFYNETFNGYDVSGVRYMTNICFGDSTSNSSCIDQYVYSGVNIAADEWLLNEDGAYGIVGLSPTSTLWNSFIDPVTR